MNNISNEILKNIFHYLPSRSYLFLTTNKNWYNVYYELNSNKKTCMYDNLSVNILKYYIKTNDFKNISIVKIVEQGHFECLTYLYDIFKKNNNLYFISDDASILYKTAAKNGNLKCLEFLLKNYLVNDRSIVEIAAKYGHLDCLKCLYKYNKYIWDSTTFYFAVISQNVECLKFLYQIECPWNDQTFFCAVIEGNLECLQFLYDYYCPYNETSSILYASSLGHLDCLRFLHLQGFSLYIEACEYACQNGQLHCLKYLRDNGCPWNQIACIKATQEYGRNICLQYIYESNLYNKNDIEYYENDGYESDDSLL